MTIQKTYVLKKQVTFCLPVAEGMISGNHFYAEPGEIINGGKNGKIHHDEITIFKSNKLAIHDVATAKLVYEKALLAGIDTSIDF